MRTKLVVACALTAFVAVSGGTAEATGLIHTSGIAKGAITFSRLSPGVQKKVAAKATAGTAGANGLNGADGSAGAAGLQGANGDRGTNGDNGAPGSKGDSGSKGDKGDTGHMGLTGHVGMTGPKGDQGAAGTNGTNGLPGAKGDIGAIGSPGAAGTSAGYTVVTHVTGADSNVCGDNWANDDYTRTLSFTMRPDGSIDVLRVYSGTFTTIAGASTPNGACSTHQVGGKVGSFTGTDVVTVTGGHFYPNATCAANCTSDAMMAAFFHGGSPVATRAISNGWEYHYDLGAETMIQADATNRGGNEGDITLG
jgi:hypothetical protein